jgi:hypothetical protein
MLTFPATGADKTPLIASGTHTIELVIRDLARVCPSEASAGRWSAEDREFEQAQIEPRSTGHLPGMVK